MVHWVSLSVNYFMIHNNWIWDIKGALQWWHISKPITRPIFSSYSTCAHQSFCFLHASLLLRLRQRSKSWIESRLSRGSHYNQWHSLSSLVMSLSTKNMDEHSSTGSLRLLLPRRINLLFSGSMEVSFYSIPFLTLYYLLYSLFHSSDKLSEFWLF